MIRVLVIGGYGNFGGTITRRLAPHAEITLLVGGRSFDRADKFCQQLKSVNTAVPVVLDIRQDIAPVLRQHRPDLVIHTSGPFQGQGYEVARACLSCGIHYCDLADGRDFVTGVGQLDSLAKENGAFAIVGASSVPTLTAAVMDDVLAQGIRVEEIDYGIATAQQTRLGRATTAATLSYAGHRLLTLVKGQMRPVYGWQDIHVEKYPDLGLRLMSNVDVPDLDLFPVRYPDLKTQRFYAGVEVKILQLGIWGLSWLVRSGLLRSLTPFADKLAGLAGIFDFLGTDKSGFHFHAKGRKSNGDVVHKSFYLIARNGDGPNIPCVPCIWIAEQMAAGKVFASGAYSGVGLMNLQDYLGLLEHQNISVIWKD